MMEDQVHCIILCAKDIVECLVKESGADLNLPLRLNLSTGIKLDLQHLEVTPMQFATIKGNLKALEYLIEDVRPTIPQIYYLSLLALESKQAAALKYLSNQIPVKESDLQTKFREDLVNETYSYEALKFIVNNVDIDTLRQYATSKLFISLNTENKCVTIKVKNCDSYGAPQAPPLAHEILLSSTIPTLQAKKYEIKSDVPFCLRRRRNNPPQYFGDLHGHVDQGVDFEGECYKNTIETQLTNLGNNGFNYDKPVQAPNPSSQEQPFALFDLDHDGRISFEELIVKNIIPGLPHNLTHSELRCLSKTTLKAADMDGDQAISMDEFEVFNQDAKAVSLHFQKHIVKTVKLQYTFHFF